MAIASRLIMFMLITASPLTFAFGMGDSFASEFKITAPTSWKRVASSFPGLILANSGSKTRQLIALYSRKLDEPSRFSLRDLMELTGPLAQIREEQLKALGLKDYAITSAEIENLRTSLTHAPFAQSLRFESQYRDAEGTMIQTIERQFHLDDRIYFIVYSEEALTLPDRGRLNHLLAQFTPKISNTRAPSSSANEIAVGRSHMPTEPRPIGANLTSKIHHPDTDGSSVCLDVPDNKRRSPTDEPTTTEQFTTAFLKGCGRQLKNDIAGLIHDTTEFALKERSMKGVMSDFSEGVSEGVKTTASTLRSGSNQAHAYLTDSRFRHEANASVYAAFESLKDPVALISKLAGNLSAAMKREAQEFSCLRTTTQGEVACKVIENLSLGAATMTAGSWAMLFGLKKATAAFSPLKNAIQSAMRELLKDSAKTANIGAKFSGAAESNASGSVRASKSSSGASSQLSMDEFGGTFGQSSSNNSKAQLKNGKLYQDGKQVEIKTGDAGTAGSGEPPLDLNFLAAIKYWAPKELHPALSKVHQRMLDEKAWNTYLRELRAESLAEMKNSSSTQSRALAEKGQLTRNAVLKVLVKRAKARGENEFGTVKNFDLDKFKSQVAKGPFFDKAFPTKKYFPGLHGADTHLIQRDFVAPTVESAMPGKSKEFYQFLGSDRGIKVWDQLFDSQSKLNPTSPEYVGQFLLKDFPTK